MNIYKRQFKWIMRRSFMEKNLKYRDSLGNPRGKNYLINSFGIILRILVRITLLKDWFALRAAKPRLIKIQFVLPELPAVFDGYRLLHLSDLHFDNNPFITKKLCQILVGYDVDLLVATGDFVERAVVGNSIAAREMKIIIDQISPKDGTVAVLGNHDSWTTAKALEDVGIQVLINEKFNIYKSGFNIQIVGIDDPSYFFDHEAVDAFHTLDKNIIGIALAHSPELAEEAASAGFNLYLAGHTHGGQFNFPYLNFSINNLQRHREYLKGKWKYGNMLGYTSCGNGTSHVAMRINCPAEVILITLNSGLKLI